MKLSENPFKNEYKLQQHLDSDHVEIPDFPKTVSRFDRLIGFLGSPAKDPVEATIGNDLSDLSVHVLQFQEVLVSLV